MKRVTIKDIARRLMLSTSTVSRALIDDKNIRRETKEKILAAAQEMGYKPNPVAKNLKYGKTNTIGMIVPEMVTPFASCVAEGVKSVLYPLGIKVLLADSGESAAKELDNLQMMERFMVDGIVICMCDYKKNREELAALARKGMPVVFYDRIPHGLDVSQVIVDDYMKSYFLVERLIRQGRRRIVHLQGPSNIYNSVERRRGYVEAMSKFGLAPECIVTESGITYSDGMRDAERILGKVPDVDCVFAFTDVLAIGVMNRLRELGHDIPGDIAVASFSGTELSEMVYPPLSTVAPPLHQMGRQAVELLMELIGNPDAPRRSVVLDADIVMRGSTATHGFDC